MLKYYLPVLGLLIITGAYLLFEDTPITFTGQATQIIKPLGTTEREVQFDFTDGTGIGISTAGGILTATTNSAEWTSNPINTRPEKIGVAYSFWEEIRFTSLNNVGVTYQTRTSKDALQWSDWSNTKEISGQRSVQSAQDKYLQLRILLPTASNEVQTVIVKYTPAFAFTLSPIYDGPMAFEETTYQPADRRVVIQGNHFYYDNGDGTYERAKFYGFQLYAPSNFPTHTQADQMCTRLRKLGVNTIKTHLFRQTPWIPQNHTLIQQWQDGITWNSGSALVFNPDSFDRLDYLIATCANQGIYTYLRIIPPEPFIDDQIPYEFYGRQEATFSLYIMQGQQTFHKLFYEQLLNRQNQYTGLQYKNDPRIAFYELTNENSLFKGWNEGRLNNEYEGPTGYDPYREITPEQNDTLNTLWHDWLRAKYADTPTLEQAWGTYVAPTSFPFDCNDSDYWADWQNSGLRSWERLEDNTIHRSDRQCRWWWAGKDKQRYRDEALFYQSLEIAYFQASKNFIKNILGAQGNLVMTNNFYDYYNYESYDEGDFIDAHSYWELGTYEPGVPKPMAENARDDKVSVILQLAKMSLHDKPFTVSEYNNGGAHLFGTDLFPMVASYAALQDWDALWAFVYFAVDFNEPETQKLGHTVTAFDPIRMSQLPLTAKAYREWISPANTLMLRNITADNLNHLSIVNCFSTLVSNGCPGVNPSTTALENNYFYQHAWRTDNYNAPTERDVFTFLSDYNLSTNPPLQTTSDTGELYVDAQQGIFQVRHSHYQGVAGRAGNTIHNLPDVTLDIKSNTRNSAGIFLGSLDDKPLSTSNKILISSGVRSENYNMTWNDTHQYWYLNYSLHSRDEWGHPPVLATTPLATITLQTAQTDLVVWALDERGVERNIIPSTYSNGELTFTLSPADETVWYVIESTPSVFSFEDVNEDGRVDVSDLSLVASRFRITPLLGDREDVNGDGEIDVVDLVYVSERFT